MKIRQILSFLMAAVFCLLAMTSCVGNVTTNETTTKAPQTTQAPVATKKPTGSDDPVETTKKPTGGDDPVETTKKPAGTDKPADTTGKAPSGETPEDWLAGYLDTMPVFTINTTDNAPIVSKEEYIGGKITVDCSEDAYEMNEAVIEIRGRGNYTWFDIEKKSYRIKFEKKTNLLGQGAGPARSWTLLAVHCDQSMLRTAAALTLAGKLSGIDFSSSVRFAHLYLNGEYMGVYQVSEQMQVQDYRVNVDDTIKEGDEIGFLVELDTQASELPVSDGFGHKYEIKSDIWNDEQYDYIADTLNIAFESLLTGEKDYVASLIDLESVVDAYLVEELFKNLDVGWGSFYMYQEVGGKLHFGPLWDFDLAAGNADANDKNPSFPMPEYIYVGSDSYNYSQSHAWFIQLVKQEWFAEMVKTRWFEILDTVNEVPAYVRAVAALYSADFDKNFERWPIFGQQINREPAQVRALKNHDEHAEYVAKWLEQRIAWMTEYFKGNVEALPSGRPGEYKGSGGKGTQRDPYLVSSAKDFNEFTYLLSIGIDFDGKYFKQTADIDMAGYIGYNGIGAAGNFAGTYNGNGYRINAVINGSDECVFPYVSGTVMNVITTGSVTNFAQAAGIARSVRRGGAIINCASAMTVTSLNQAAAGITASNQSGGGTVSGCIFIGTLACEVQTGAINIFIEGRGGEFSYNYCLDTSVGSSVGNETVFKASEYEATVTAVNANLTKLSGADARLLCKWSLVDGVPTMEHQ